MISYRDISEMLRDFSKGKALPVLVFLLLSAVWVYYFTNTTSSETSNSNESSININNSQLNSPIVVQGNNNIVTAPVSTTKEDEDQYLSAFDLQRKVDKLPSTFDKSEFIDNIAGTKTQDIGFIHDKLKGPLPSMYSLFIEETQKDYPYSSLMCNFPISLKNQLIARDIGEQIKFRGVVMGGFSFIVLKDCSLVVN